MPFVCYSNDDNSQVYISVDKYGRILLSAGLRRKLGYEKEEVQLFVFFEEESRRIGLAKDYPGKNKPFKFDNRGYAVMKEFLSTNDIEYKDDVTVRYYYDGNFNGILAFKASRTSERVETAFRQEKNGNLERIQGA